MKKIYRGSFILSLMKIIGAVLLAFSTISTWFTGEFNNNADYSIIWKMNLFKEYSFRTASEIFSADEAVNDTNHWNILGYFLILVAIVIAVCGTFKIIDIYSDNVKSGIEINDENNINRIFRKNNIIQTILIALAIAGILFLYVYTGMKTNVKSGVASIRRGMYIAVAVLVAMLAVHTFEEIYNYHVIQNIEDWDE